MNRKPTLRTLLLLASLVLLLALATACGSVAASPLEVAVAGTPTPTEQPAEEPATEAETDEAAAETEATTETAVSDDPLVGVTWQWQGFSDTAGLNDIEVDAPTQYTAAFNEDGTVAIKADCNVAQGTYETEGSSLTIQLGPSTLAMCPPESLSDRFIALLGDVASYVMDGDNLVLNLKMDAGNMVFAPESGGDEATEEPEAPANDLVGVTWEWLRFADTAEKNDIDVADPSQYTLTFGEDGTVAVKADCNVANGTYEAEDSSLTIQLGPTTLAMCPPESLSDQFMALLGDVVTYVMNEGNLALNLKVDAGNMIFAPAGADQGDDAAASEDEDDAAAGEPADEVDFVAVYRALLPAASSPGRLITLILSADNMALLTTDYLNDEPPIIEKGAWEIVGDNQVELMITGQVDKEYDEPVSIVFEMDGDDFRAVDYDVTLYGENGLPLTKETLRDKIAPAGAAKRALVSIDLDAGFALDPFLVSVNGGGPIDAGKFVEGCSGYVHQHPVVSVDWEGESDFVEVFFYSDHDPTLIVQTPDGEYLCSDDANALLLDPVVEIENPSKGVYNIWVGSYHRHQLIPGILVLTTQPDINVGTFDLGNLIKRAPVPEVLPAYSSPLDAELVTEVLGRYKGDVASLTQEAGAVSADVTSEGEIAAFDLPLEGVRCTGFISDTPDFVFDWAGEAKALGVFFEGDSDASLLVVTPQRTVICNDDATHGENNNPLLLVDDPAEGRYAVFVGRLNPETPVSGQITATTAEVIEHAILAPAQQ